MAPSETADILASIGAASYVWDIASDTLTWSANIGRVLATDPACLATGRLYARLLDPDTLQTRFDAVMHSVQRDDGNGVSFQVEYCLRVGPEPQVKIWIEDCGRWFASAGGQPARAHGVIRIVNERRAQQERLSFLSRYDGLTGEMNRWHLSEVLAEALQNSIRFRTSCGFLLVAIDNLARINHAYGFAAADEVIAAVAKRIRLRMRGGDSLGRFSGNKFGIVLNNCTPEDMASAADRLLAAVRDEVVPTSTGCVAVTATIGGVTAPRHGRTVHEILARAQESLDNAKERRRGSFCVYRPNIELERIRRENARATDDIIAAVNDRRVLLAFEPVVDATSRQPVFHECLVRVRRPDGTLAAADEIVPMAEHFGLIRLIDHRVVELAIPELVHGADVCLSINVSPASAVDPDWWAAFVAHMHAHSGFAERVIVEITETTPFQNIEDAESFVARVRDLGCRVAIDDFGAGSTSYRMLRRLAVDIIKIDGSFIQALTHSADDRLFVRSIIELARGLEVATVAEWVQDAEAAAMLNEWGCDYLQGSFVGAPSVQPPWQGKAAAPLAGTAP